MSELCPFCGKLDCYASWRVKEEDSFGWSPQRAKIWRAVEEFSREQPEPTHTLKISPEYFAAVEEGSKTFEVRRGNDRIYKVGDTVLLREFFRDREEYSGREMFLEVTYVMHGPPLLTDDIWVFGIKKA